MRKYYIDNIKTIIILILFPLHTFMIWNNFGLKFYIWGGSNNLISSLIILVNPWLMPVLFIIAGMNARYSLEKRTKKEFIKERFTKLLIPFLCGLILLIPWQTLIARKYFFAYRGNFITNLQYFLTHVTDFTGYDGAFTPSHLWFILFLFIISLIFLIISHFLPLKKFQNKFKTPHNIFLILLMFIFLYLFNFIGNFGGKSIGQALILFLLGYYLFVDEFIETIEKHKTIIFSLYFISQISLTILYYIYNYYGDLLVNFVSWTGILSVIIISHLHLNKNNKLTTYLSKASYAIYILHQTILVIIGYFALTMLNNIFFQIFIILFGSLFITLILYELIRRIPYLRKIIGLK